MAPAYKLFCMGNPLLDIQVTGGEKLLEQYGLKANDAILAEEKHAPIYEEIVRDYKPTYVAGGAAQNAARGASYCLPPNSVVYTGCVGNDNLADQLRVANKREGLADAYMVKEGEKTGACAVIITDHNRSLVTTLRAAEKFELSHLKSSQVVPLIENAKLFYVEGYFLTHGNESATYLAKHASTTGKTFVLNLSAPFIPQFFKVQVESIIQFCDVIIGNESEAEAWASASGLPSTDLATIARTLAIADKANPAHPRTVIFTQGKESTIVAVGEADATPKSYPVHPIPDDQIVDTNGAGDAFAGGVLAALISGKSIDEAIEAGHKLGAMCIQQTGPQYKWPKENIL